MQPNDVPVKTAAGNREIMQRAHKLSPRARSLLIMIHGSDTLAEIKRSLSAFGDVDASVTELCTLGLINARTTGAIVAPASTSATAAADVVPPTQQAKQLLNESAVAALGLGLRSYLFTLKLEHCYTVQELRGILPEYRRVVAKAKGDEFAKAMVVQVETILSRA